MGVSTIKDRRAINVLSDRGAGEMQGCVRRDLAGVRAEGVIVKRGGPSVARRSADLRGDRRAGGDQRAEVRGLGRLPPRRRPRPAPPPAPPRRPRPPSLFRRRRRPPARDRERPSSS